MQLEVIIISNFNLKVNLDDFGISLREEKYAKTKLNILNAVLNKLKTTSLEDINLSDLCKEISISKRTFFNYFPLKHYVLFYLMQIWIIEISELAYKTHGKTAGLDLIFTGFEEFGKKILNQPKISFEIFSSLLIREIDITKFSKLSKAEEILWKLDTSLLDEVPMLSFNNLITTAINNAKLEGSLPKEIDIQTIELSLSCILVGVPFALRETGFMNIVETYKRQLDILWAGLRNL